MVPTPHTDRLWTLHPGSLSRPTYLAPPTPQGPFSLQEAAGATRSHEAGPGARQAVVWESEGGAGCAGLWTPRRAVSPPHPAREKDQLGESQGTACGQVRFPGAEDRGRAGAHTRKNSLSWGLLLSAGMCTVKRSKSSAPFRRSSITEASNRPAPARTRDKETTVTHGDFWPPGHFSWSCLRGSEQPPGPYPILPEIHLGSAWGKGLARRDLSPYSSIYQMSIKHLLCGWFRRRMRAKRGLCPHGYYIPYRGKQATNKKQIISDGFNVLGRKVRLRAGK